jgi:hypothetical protein
MAYPINHNLDGTYVIARLGMPAATAVGLERALHIQEDVIRHMLIRGIMGSDEAPPEFISERPRFAPRAPMPMESRGEAQAPAAEAPAPEAAAETEVSEAVAQETAAPEAGAPEAVVPEVPAADALASEAPVAAAASEPPPPDAPAEADAD